MVAPLELPLFKKKKKKTKESITECVPAGCKSR